MTKAQALGAGTYVKKLYVSEKLGLAARKDLIAQHSVDFEKRRIRIYFWFSSLGNFPGVSLQAGRPLTLYDNLNV